jgi:hypothetical protein
MLDHGVDINRTDYSRTASGFRLAGPNDTSLKVLNGVAARGDIELYDHLIARRVAPSRSPGWMQEEMVVWRWRTSSRRTRDFRGVRSVLRWKTS